MSWLMHPDCATNRRFCKRAFAGALALGVLGSLAFAPRVNAVVVSGMDPLPNPSNGYVGTFNGSSCVAVGKHWFISAKHVAGNVGQSIIMRGVWYNVLEIRAHPLYDVQLLRVGEELPGHHRLANAPAYGDTAFLAGYGVTAAAALPNDGGYDWNGPRQETWGANVIEGEGSLLTVRFDKPSDTAAVPHEAIFAVNDSGGGLFTLGADGSYELAGIAVSVFGFGSAQWYNSAFALNVTLYRNWMMPIVDPDTPVSSGVMAPRAMLGVPGLGAFEGACIFTIAAALTRRRR
jgi:hypothetical protein